MLAPIIEEQRLCASLTLVIAGARSNRIDVAPVILRLRMNVRIAVDLRCRSLKDPPGASQRQNSQPRKIVQGGATLAAAKAPGVKALTLQMAE